MDSPGTEARRCAGVIRRTRRKTTGCRECYAAARSGATVVGLVPNVTDQRCWRDVVLRASEIRFIIGRIAFAGTTSSNTHGSALVIFRPDESNQADGPHVSWLDRDQSLLPAVPRPAPGV
jgi:hypothetical protein